MINMNDLLFVFWCLLDAENDIIDLLDNLIRSFPIAFKFQSFLSLGEDYTTKLSVVLESSHVWMFCHRLFSHV